MFRKPMRLEKWVAFDGALGAEVLQTAQESGADGFFAGSASAETVDNANAAADSAGAVEIGLQSFGAASPVVSPLSVETGTITLDLPNTWSGAEATISYPTSLVLADADAPSLPFWGDSGSSISIDFRNYLFFGPYAVNGIFFEVFCPSGGEDGSFTFFNPNTMDLAEFLSSNQQLNDGDTLVYVDQILEHGVMGLKLGRLSVNGSGASISPQLTLGEQFAMALATEDSIRFSYSGMRGPFGAESHINDIFKSLVYLPDGEAAAHNGGDIALRVFYTGWSVTPSDPGNYLDSGAYSSENHVGGPWVPFPEQSTESGQSSESGGIESPNEPERPELPGEVEQGGEDGEPEQPEVSVPSEPEVSEEGAGPPESENSGESSRPEEPTVPEDPGTPMEPGTPAVPGELLPPEVDSEEGETAEPGEENGFIPPVNEVPPSVEPPIPSYPATESDSFDVGDDETTSPIRTATPVSEPAMAGAAPSLAGPQYVHNRDDELAEREPASDVVDEEDKVVDVSVELDGHLPEAGVLALGELVREYEAALALVVNERDLLERSLEKLLLEYKQRPIGEWDGSRHLIREIFESGNREIVAIDRITGQMHRQMSLFRGLGPERLDGMLTESVRELIDSAERHSGETLALSHAVNSVVKELSETRAAESVAPDGERLEDIYRHSYERQHAEWARENARQDPMGKELSTYQMTSQG